MYCFSYEETTYLVRPIFTKAAETQTNFSFLEYLRTSPGRSQRSVCGSGIGFQFDYYVVIVILDCTTCSVISSSFINHLQRFSPKTEGCKHFRLKSSITFWSRLVFFTLSGECNLELLVYQNAILYWIDLKFEGYAILYWIDMLYQVRWLNADFISHYCRPCIWQRYSRKLKLIWVSAGFGKNYSD